MPLCPRCGAAHQRELEVCRECGKRLLHRPRVAVDQTSLSFPTCIDGPDGCEGPPSEGPDGQLRCSAHHLAGRLRLSDQRPQPHQEPADQPTRWAFLKRWFKRR